MKKICILGFLAAGLCMYSCNKDVDSLPEPQKSQVETLTFASVEEMEQTVSSLLKMSEEEREDWYAKFDGFTSQESFQWEVVDELDNATSMEEVRAIQAKYSEQLLFNMNEADEDISPYLPSSKGGYSLVLNKDGNVEIAGKLTNFNDLTSYDQTRAASIEVSSTRAMPQGVNKVSCQVGDRKCFAYSYRVTLAGVPVVGIEYGAHKKSLFGWNKYRTEYCVQVINVFPGWDVWDSQFLSLVQSRQPTWTVELPDATWLPIGSTQSLGNGRWAQGNMDVYVYSRGTGEAGKMLLIISI